jgi:hypothetical protein
MLTVPTTAMNLDGFATTIANAKAAKAITTEKSIKLAETSHLT